MSHVEIKTGDVEIKVTADAPYTLEQLAAIAQVIWREAINESQTIRNGNDHLGNYL